MAKTYHSRSLEQLMIADIVNINNNNNKQELQQQQQ